MNTAPLSPARRLTGRIVTGLVVAFLAFDLYLKLAAPPMAVEGTVALGWPASILFPLGLIQAAALTLYLIPRTALLGALLWTGYLGGAVATHVRIGHPLFSHTLFPIYVALFLWVGLALRDRRVAALWAPVQ